MGQKPFMGPRQGNEFDQREMKRVMTTASMCTPHIVTMRPDMNRVQMLRGEDSQLNCSIRHVNEHR
ncbi:hypothetical protein F2Q70_00023881 [Brassica cretica]|uniref:Uncharacterized protein n=1 Tax=Brassica cretica TaxID=69181 RepID=A0A8S9GSQ7_BRACR|nr:hypothetical protein F2Q70_00023881 [Brassica cretica]KAF3610220.1 hypothetical protein DY000_02051317 [Brassica cretica]